MAAKILSQYIIANNYPTNLHRKAILVSNHMFDRCCRRVDRCCRRVGCRRVDLSPSWMTPTRLVADLTGYLVDRCCRRVDRCCRRVGCRRVDLSPSWMSPTRLVADLTGYQIDLQRLNMCFEYYCHAVARQIIQYAVTVMNEHAAILRH